MQNFDDAETEFRRTYWYARSGRAKEKNVVDLLRVQF